MAEMENTNEGVDEYDRETRYCQSSMELKKYLKSSVENVLRNVMDEKFVRIYKACYKEFEKRDDVDRPSLSGSSVEARKYRSQFNDFVIKSISETIDETVLNMDCKLKELEELTKEQSDNTVFWRPPGNALQHMIPFDYVCQTQQKRELEDTIKKEEEALNVLKARLQQKRNKATELNEVLLSLFDEVKKIVTNEVHEGVVNK